MNIEYLVRMANDIGAFFDNPALANEAKGDIASHLKRFWDRRMRAAIVSHVDAGGEGLHPVVAAAIRDNRASLRGSPRPIAANPHWIGPEGVSDAG